MKEIIYRLHENRQVEVAKSILENAGYKVSNGNKVKRLKESASWESDSTSRYGEEYFPHGDVYGYVSKAEGGGFYAAIMNSSDDDVYKDADDFDSKEEAKRWVERNIKESRRPTGKRLKESTEDKRQALVKLYQSNPGEFWEIMNDYSPFYIDNEGDLMSPNVRDDEIEELYSDLEDAGYFSGKSHRDSLYTGYYPKESGFKNDGDGGYIKYYDNGKVGSISVVAERERSVYACIYSDKESYMDDEYDSDGMFQSTEQAIEWCDKMAGEVNESRRVKGRKLKESRRLTGKRLNKN